MKLAFIFIFRLLFAPRSAYQWKNVTTARSLVPLVGSLCYSPAVWPVIAFALDRKGSKPLFQDSIMKFEALFKI